MPPARRVKQSLFRRFQKIEFKHMPCPNMARTLKLGPNGSQALRKKMWCPPGGANTCAEARERAEVGVAANPTKTFL